jgi:hypothetical protein
VVGVGAVPLPLSHRTAHKLCDVARPARYGLRDKTLLDPRVRDTWEIGKRQIKLDTRRWQRTLDPKLDLIARDLGPRPRAPASRRNRKRSRNVSLDLRSGSRGLAADGPHGPPPQAWPRWVCRGRSSTGRTRQPRLLWLLVQQLLDPAQHRNHPIVAVW